MIKGLLTFQGVELQLKHVQAVGVYGWGSVCETIIGEWLEDISQNQVRVSITCLSWLDIYAPTIQQIHGCMFLWLFFLQIHKLLKGLPPVRSLVAVGSSAAKLVSLPVKNYKKDRRIVKGMQRGNECIKAMLFCLFNEL